MDQPNTPDRPVSRKEARRLLNQVAVGVGAMLLAAVDDWNALSARHSAHLRTVMQGLGRGTYVAAAVAAGTDVWLSTRGMHPPGHTVVKPYRWPEINSRGKTHMMIHHNEMEPTTPRRTAFFTQDSATLGLIGDPTHCELTWDYDIVTDTHIRRIWVSAPLDCSFHDPGGRVFLGAHIAHRDQLQRLTADAHERGDAAAVELNTAMLDKVSKLISEIDPNTTQEPQ